MASAYLHTSPHTFHHFPLFTVSTASTFIFRTGGHFPAVGDRYGKRLLPKTVRGGPFLAGDTYLRDKPFLASLLSNVTNRVHNQGDCMDVAAALPLQKQPRRPFFERT